MSEGSASERFHLVGHDWGGFVAWSFAARYPGRLTTLSSLSSPHPVALLQSMMTSRQGLAWQAYLFQLPVSLSFFSMAAAQTPTAC
jgi:pimeloyl-ACP methyl ester carboxylesterase